MRYVFFHKYGKIANKLLVTFAIDKSYNGHEPCDFVRSGKKGAIAAVLAANRNDVQGAVCEIAQPGGCLGAPIQRAEDAANNNGTKHPTLYHYYLVSVQLVALHKWHC